MNKFTLTKDRVFDACIFDFDGTLVDTEKYHFVAWQKAFESVNIQFSPEEYIPLRSTGRANVIEYVERKHGLHFSDEQKRSLCSIKQQHFTSFVQSISQKDIIKGAVPFLEFLQANGIVSAVATSGTQAKDIAKKLSLYNYFSLFLDSANIERKKPFPDIFIKVADLLGVPAENCLVFEDSIVGVEAGIAAKMQVVSVGELQDARALMCVSDFCALLQK